MTAGVPARVADCRSRALEPTGPDARPQVSAHGARPCPVLVPPPSVQVAAATGTTSLPAACKGAGREEREAGEGPRPGALRARAPCARLRGAGGGAETGDGRGFSPLLPARPGRRGPDGLRVRVPAARAGRTVCRGPERDRAAPGVLEPPVKSRSGCPHSQQPPTPRPSFVFRDGGPGMTVFDLPLVLLEIAGDSFGNPWG